MAVYNIGDRVHTNRGYTGSVSEVRWTGDFVFYSIPVYQVSWDDGVPDGTWYTDLELTKLDESA